MFVQNTCVCVRGMAKTGLLPYTVEVVSESDTVTAYAGLPTVVETMRTLGLSRQIDAELGVRQRKVGATDAQKVEALVLLMAAGGECLADINILRADKGLERLLGNELPSEDTLLSFLYRFHDDELIEQAKHARRPKQVAYIPRESRPLAALANVNVALVHAVNERMKLTHATLDHDATIQESHKKQAMAHYKDGRGYQPSVIYFVEGDMVVGDEYRDGNVPAGMENLRLIQKGFAALPASIQTRALRGDSALYEQKVLKWLSDPKRPDGPEGTIAFSISADMSEPLVKECRAVAGGAWAMVDDRARETVSVADVEFASGDWSKDAEPLRYIAIKIVGKQLDLEGRLPVRYLAVVSNRKDLSAPALVRWHWEKAGTIEHVHDVTKNELGMGTPPCGRFGANAAWFRIGMLAYNVLSAMKQLALPPSMETARPKRMRFSLFHIAGRITTHAGKIVLKLGELAERIAQLVQTRQRLGALAT